MATSRVTVIKDDSKALQASLLDLMRRQVLIGIPDDAKRADGDAISLATIAYVMEFGSPKQNIPARAFLVPGVERSKRAAARQLEIALRAVIDKNMGAADAALNKAGLIAQNEVRDVILSNIAPPLRPKTIAARARARGGKRRENEIAYLRAVARGRDPGAAQAAQGITALVNTGQLLNAITYVVKAR